MQIDAKLRNRVLADLEALGGVAAASAFPPADSLSQALTKTIAGVPRKHSVTRNIARDTAIMFTTAAVNMWMRAVHSFLISCSLTDVSPTWSSATGYYSSHYSIRAFAHLLGYFRLFTLRRTARLEILAGRYVCNFDEKAGREHQIYWALVKDDQHFMPDPFFIHDNSEVDHRDWAQYADHIPQFPQFRPLNREALKARIDRISEIPFATPPIPQADRFPDVDSVQIIAYHRLVRFRSLVDALLRGKNRFWDVHRNPNWATDFMDFQITAGRTLHSEFTL